MSRLIKKPIAIPSGVEVKDDGGFLVVRGPKGTLRIPLPASVGVKIAPDGIAIVPKEARSSDPIYGTVWSLVKNAMTGVAGGFSKVLEIEGVGYRAVVEGKEVVLFLGYVHPVRLAVPEGITVGVEKNVITIVGFDKDLVGRVASEIRAHKKPEPYKGKGIRYRGEVIRRKVGKKAGATAAA